jgi:hypothetical protein
MLRRVKKDVENVFKCYMYFQMMIIKREHYTIVSIHKKSVENQNKILNILKDNNEQDLNRRSP